MSEIKVGDLVVVVRPTTCCGAPDSIGEIFIAGDAYHGLARCIYCNVRCPDDYVWVGGEKRVKERSRLRRIPPLWELDETEHKEELPA